MYIERAIPHRILAQAIQNPPRISIESILESPHNHDQIFGLFFYSIELLWNPLETLKDSTQNPCRVCTESLWHLARIPAGPLQSPHRTLAGSQQNLHRRVVRIESL